MVLASARNCQYIVTQQPLCITWAPTKDRINAHWHGIRFADAAKISDGATLERVDDRFDYGEIRVDAIGLVNDVEVTR
jgi:uncharacterized protein